MQRIFAQRLRQLRQERKWTQAQLAQKLHKSESTIRMWELDKNEPDFKTLREIALLFATSCDDLLGLPAPCSAQIQNNPPAVQEITKLCQEASPTQLTQLLRIVQAALATE